MSQCSLETTDADMHIDVESINYNYNQYMSKRLPGWSDQIGFDITNLYISELN